MWAYNHSVSNTINTKIKTLINNFFVGENFNKDKFLLLTLADIRLLGLVEILILEETMVRIENLHGNSLRLLLPENCNGMSNNSVIAILLQIYNDHVVKYKAGLGDLILLVKQVQQVVWRLWGREIIFDFGYT